MMSNNNRNIPHMMTIREVARTGIMSEYTLRAMVKQGRVKVNQNFYTSLVLRLV